MVKKILDILAVVIRVLCTVLLTVITIGVFTQVMMRYVFNAPVFWLEEFVINQMIWAVFLGVPLGVMNRSHTRITFFVNLLPEKIRRWLEVATQTLCLVWILFISYHGMTSVKATMRSLSTALQIPRGLLYLALPACGVLIAVYLLFNIVQDIKANLEGAAAESSTEEGQL